MGLVAGLVFHWLYKRSSTIVVPAVVAGILGSLVNTVLVLGFMGLFYTNATAQAYGVDASVLFRDTCWNCRNQWDSRSYRRWDHHTITRQSIICSHTFKT